MRLGDKRKIGSADGDEDYATAENENRSLGRTLRNGRNGGARQYSIYKRADKERDTLVGQGLEGFGVYDLGPVVGHFGSSGIANAGEKGSFGEKLGIATEDARHIFPDGETGGGQAIGHNGSRIIGAFAAEGDKILGRIGPYKALRDKYFCCAT